MSQEKKLGTSEIEDVICFLEALADELQKAKEDDGIIKPEEITKSMRSCVPEVVKAAWGSWRIPMEVADIDDEEAQDLLKKVVPIGVKLVGLFK